MQHFILSSCHLVNRTVERLLIRTSLSGGSAREVAPTSTSIAERQPADKWYTAAEAVERSRHARSSSARWAGAGRIPSATAGAALRRRAAAPARADDRP